jgi:hypothetical protein
MEIMDLMTKHLHDAFQKLYRWIQRELKHLSLESPQINSGIRRALRVLAERPTLFQYCSALFCTTVAEHCSDMLVIIVEIV